MANDESFPKAARLRKRAEYLSVQGRGRKVQADHFFVLLLPAQTSGATVRTRVGITVSSKVGNAVVRARLRRWVREYVRRHQTDLPAGDLVVIAKTSAAAAVHPACDADLARLFLKAREIRV